MIENGGPAFPVRNPCKLTDEGAVVDVRGWGLEDHPGMSLRDWFAGMVIADDRLVKTVRGMDDKDLAYFARYPDSEVDFFCLGNVEKYVLRYELEARAIARVRYMQADAMLSARKEQPKP